MQLRDLKTWQRALLVDISLLVGIALSAIYTTLEHPRVDVGMRLPTGLLIV
jgi:hypothetical protein